jgi:hypothetical protein
MDNWGGNKPFKGLLIGDSGAGKTAAVSYLANEGYELFWADFDNGLSIVPKLIKDKAALKRIRYKTFTDKMQTIGGAVFSDGCPSAATNFVENLSGWMDDGTSYGPLHTWGPEQILVLDSMTFFGSAIMRRHLFLNKRNGQKPFQSDWGDAMDNLEAVLSLLYSESIKCNVVVTSHITFIAKATGEIDAKGEEIRMDKGYPSALGSKLPPKIVRYFDVILLVKSMTPTPGVTVRQILTQSDGLVELKCPAIRCLMPCRWNRDDRGLQGDEKPDGMLQMVPRLPARRIRAKPERRHNAAASSHKDTRQCQHRITILCSTAP